MKTQFIADVQAFLALNSAIKTLEDQRDALKARLREAAEATKGKELELDGYRVTVTECDRTNVRTKQLIEKYPELVDELVYHTQYNRTDIVKVEEETEAEKTESDELKVQETKEITLSKSEAA